MKLFFRLKNVENLHPATKASDLSFIILIQRAALLGLKDAGYIDEMQHRQAETALMEQYREDWKVIQFGEQAND